MTQPSTIQPADGTAGDGGAEVGDVLDAVRRSLLLVLESLPDPPQRLRVHAADVAIELEWPVGTGPTVEAAPAAPAAPPAPVSANGASPTTFHVGAPSVGAFYRAPEPGAKPFVSVGDVVRPGQQIAIVEAMKLMLPVEADRPGRVVDVLKSDGEPVEYGEPLFLLAPVESP
jgi:acetyl-CoA carboxylase biotin carboxyl carrier protein